MRLLNNKGFAITSILYVLFILFLLILISVLSGLSSKKNMAEKTLEMLEDSFIGVEMDRTDEKVIEAQELGIAPVTGKYIFMIDGTNTLCSTYLTRGTNWNEEDVTYIPKDCNDYEVDMTLMKIYSFEDEGSL